MDVLIGIGIFILALIVIEGAYFAFKSIRDSEKKRVKARLRELSLAMGDESRNIDIVRKKSLSEVPWLNRLLLSFRWTDRAHRLLEQAGIQHSLGLFVLISLLFAFLGILVALRLTVTLNPLVFTPVVVFLGILPTLYIYLKKNRRMKRFESQLPDSMDLIARSLKAGHAFSSGLKMVADEMDDPLSTEMGKTLNEINFGVGVTEALKNLSDRVECPDLKFFVISIIMQRETGGNLAEILENIAYIIRERFKLHGRIRVLSAEGRFSAAVLIALPFFVAFVISLMNPGYIGTLITDPIGKIMIVFALVMLVLGIFTMKRMIKIDV